MIRAKIKCVQDISIKKYKRLINLTRTSFNMPFTTRYGGNAMGAV
jgi:hypothetical protein